MAAPGGRARLLALALLLVADASGPGRGAGPAEEEVEQGIKEAIGAGGSCGINSVLEGGSFEPLAPGDVPRCGKLVNTNCTVAYSRQCPSECPYIVPHRAFACFYTCAAETHCSDSNPNRAFPDPQSMVCRNCNITACRWCKEPTVCGDCHDGFEMSADGKACLFTVDQKLRLQLPVQIVGAAIGIIILIAIVYPCFRKVPECREQNLRSIYSARQHRKRTKVQEWNLSPQAIRRGVIAERVRMFEDMHHKNVVGVGLALFYNNLCFTILVSLLFYAVSTMVYMTSDAGVVLASFGRSDYDLVGGGIKLPHEAPAMLVSRLDVCTDSNLGDMHAGLERFSHHSFYGVTCLYWVLLAALYVFANSQKRFERDFNSRNQTMSDYALRMDGFPADATDEGELRSWLQEALKSKVQQARGGTHNPPPSDSMQIHGVSIMYDYRVLWGEVDELLQKMNIALQIEDEALARPGDLQDVEASRRRAMLAETHKASRRRAMLAETHKAGCDTVRLWFEMNKMKSTGGVFVIFTTVDALERAWETIKAQGGLDYPGGYRISVSLVTTEPPSINWWHAGTTSAALRKNGATVLVKVLLMVAFVQVLCLTSTYFVVLPYSRIGSAAGGMTITVAGQVIGILNMVVGMQTWGLCYSIGFQTKEAMDTLILFLNTFVTLLNLSLNYATVVYTIFEQNVHEGGWDTFFSVSNLVRASLDNSLAQSIYGLMVPGSLFVGFLMTIVMAGIWPWIFNNFLMKLIYVWRALPDPLLRVVKAALPYAPDDLDEYPFWRAEKALEPMEIQIGDYANTIVIPTICSSMLIFASPYSKWMFQAMLGWSIFYYGFCRYLHLRFCKTCYYTSSVIDRFVNLLWCVPLSAVGVAGCIWGIRSRHIAPGWPASAHIAVVILWGVVSGLLWALIYELLIVPRVLPPLPEAKKLTFQEVKEDTLYDWLNCNPVYVLKSRYYFQDPDGRTMPRRNSHQHPLACGEIETEVRFYSVGKEFLFVAPSRRKLAVEQAQRAGPLEIEYWLHLLTSTIKETDMSEIMTGFLEKSKVNTRTIIPTEITEKLLGVKG